MPGPFNKIIDLTQTTAAFGRARPLVPPQAWVWPMHRDVVRGVRELGQDEMWFVFDVGICCGQGAGIAVAVQSWAEASHSKGHRHAWVALVGGRDARSCSTEIPIC